MNTQSLKTRLFKMKNLNKYFAVAVLLSAALFSCNKEESKTEQQHATLRYETVPYVSAAQIPAHNAILRSESNFTDRLVYHGYDDDKYYYVFLLGHVNLVPIAYRPAIYYNGITPITIGYSKTNATEQSITSTFQTAMSYSVTSSMNFSAGITTSIGFKAGIAEGSLALNVGSNIGTSTGDSRSTVNSEETMRSATEQITDNIEATIGNNNEPAGQYRYALMGTTDVYYVLITDHAKSAVNEQYFAV